MRRGIVRRNPAMTEGEIAVTRIDQSSKRVIACSVSGQAAPSLLFQFALFRRVGGAGEFDAVAVGVGERCDPEMVSHRGTFRRLDSA